MTGADDNPLEGAEFPRLVEWTCHRVLACSRGDPRAAEWLARAHEALQAQAATHRRRRAAPGLPLQHPVSPRDRCGVGTRNAASR